MEMDETLLEQLKMGGNEESKLHQFDGKSLSQASLESQSQIAYSQ